MTTEPKCPHCDAGIDQLTYVDPVEHLWSMVMNEGKIYLSFDETNYDVNKASYIYCSGCDKESPVPFEDNDDNVFWD